MCIIYVLNQPNAMCDYNFIMNMILKFDHIIPLV